MALDTFVQYNLGWGFLNCDILSDSSQTNNNRDFLVFQLIGLCILMAGMWAWSEKDMFQNLSKLTTLALDPAFILICSGAITFIIGFAGCVGALRESTCLLAAVISILYYIYITKIY